MTITYRKRKTKDPLEGGVRYHCNICHKDITLVVRIKCAECDDLDICVECFSQRAEIGHHKSNHSYRVMDSQQKCVYSPDWSAEEEWLLLDAIESTGMGNWTGISEFIGTKTKEECQDHYQKIYVDSATFPLPLKTIPQQESLKAKKLTMEGIQWKGMEEYKAKISSMVPPPKLQSVPANHEVTGYMPLRREFDTETENDAEMAVKDLVFFDDDSPNEIELKLTMLEIYNTKLEKRYEKRRFVHERGFIDFKRHQTIEKSRPREEKETLEGIKCFARFMTALDMNDFYQGIFAEKELRHRIAQLNELRRNGITCLEVGQEYLKKGGKVLPRFTAPNSPRGFGTPLDLSKSEGVELLSPQESELCTLLRLLPKVYLNIKETLLSEYHRTGHLKRSRARQLIRIDVNKTSKVYDFFVTVGWVKPPESIG